MLISRNEKVKIIAILSIISIIILLIFQGEFYPYAYLLVALLGGVGIEWNLYTYCGGNPINYVDPSGHKLTPKQKAAKKIIKKVSSWLGAKTKMI